jgi:hypothetical protein
LWENLRERDHLGDSGVDGRIILTKINNIQTNRANYLFNIGCVCLNAV